MFAASPHGFVGFCQDCYAVGSSVDVWFSGAGLRPIDHGNRTGCKADAANCQQANDQQIGPARTAFFECKESIGERFSVLWHHWLLLCLLAFCSLENGRQIAKHSAEIVSKE